MTARSVEIPLMISRQANQKEHFMHTHHVTQTKVINLRVSWDAYREFRTDGIEHGETNAQVFERWARDRAVQNRNNHDIDTHKAHA